MSKLRVLYCAALAALLISQLPIVAQQPKQYILYTLLRNGNIVKIFPNGSMKSVGGVGKAFYSIDVYGNRIYIPDLNMGKVKVYNLDGKFLRYISMPETEGFAEIVALPKGRVALIDNALDVIFILNDYGTLLKTIDLPVGLDNKRQVVDAGVVNETLYVFDGASGMILRVYLNNYMLATSMDIQSKLGEEIRAVAFTSGNYYLATRSRIYNSSFDLVAELEDWPIESIVVAGDHLYVAVGFGGKIYEVNIKTGNVSVYASGLDYPIELTVQEIELPSSPTPTPTTAPPTTTTPPTPPSTTPSPTPYLPTISKQTLIWAYGLIGGGILFIGLTAILIRRRRRPKRPKYPVWTEGTFEEPMPVPMEELKVEVEPKPEEFKVKGPSVEKVKEEVPEIPKPPLEKVEEVEKPERIGEVGLPVVSETKEEKIDIVEPEEPKLVELEEVEKPKPIAEIKEKPKPEKAEKVPVEKVKREIKMPRLRALIEEAKKEMELKEHEKVPVAIIRKEGLKIPKKPIIEEVKKEVKPEEEKPEIPSILEEFKKELVRKEPKPKLIPEPEPKPKPEPETKPELPEIEETGEEKKPVMPKEIFIEKIFEKKPEEPEIIEEIREEVEKEIVPKEIEEKGIPPPETVEPEKIVEELEKPALSLEETLKEERLKLPEKPSILEEFKKEVLRKKPTPEPELPTKPVPEPVKEEVRTEEKIVKEEKLELLETLEKPIEERGYEEPEVPEEISVKSLWEYFKEKARKEEKAKEAEEEKKEEELKPQEEEEVEEEIDVEDLWEYLRKKYESEKGEKSE